MALRYFIFDLDGTLIDTEKAVLETWRQTLREYRYFFTPDEVRCVLGVTIEIGLGLLGVKVDPDYQEKWQKNYSKYAREADYFTGIKEMLDILKKKGLSIGAVSSRSRKEYDAYFKGFGFEEYFDAVVLEEDTKKHKPDPEPLYRYMEIMRADPTECIYIGDMSGDIQCANSAGILSGLAMWKGTGTICDEAGVIFGSVEDVVRLAG